MRRIKTTISLLLLFLALFTVSVRAQQAPALHSPSYNSGYATFAPLSSVTTSTYLDFSSALYRTHTIDWSVTPGAVTVCTFNVDASSDTVNWFDISGPQTCTSANMFHIESKPVRYLRIHIQTYTGTAPLTFHYAGVN